MAGTEAKNSIEIWGITNLFANAGGGELRKKVWGIEDLEVFPALALIPMREVGAVLIGAFDGERMIGFVFGFPGQEQRHAAGHAGESGRLILHSDMLAVTPEYRAHGLGYRLKLAQRERALANGINTITWTFDPLQSLNAHLNIAKLGVIADSYRVNYYGETTSFLHGTGTDRLWVTWSLNSDRVRQRVELGQRSSALKLDDVPLLVRVGEEEEPLIEEMDLDTPAVCIEIPDNINGLRRDNPERAIKWRCETRQVFMTALDASFIVVEFFRIERNGKGIGRYLLLSDQARGKLASRK